MVCVDVGQNQIFACKYLPQKHGRLLTSGGLGTMGYALPAAVGAKVACPERQTLVVCGDGSFQMAMNELAAIRAGGLDSRSSCSATTPWVWSTRSRAPPPTTGPFGGTRITWTRRWTVFLGTQGSCLLICEVHPDVGTND